MFYNFSKILKKYLWRTSLLFKLYLQKMHIYKKCIFTKNDLLLGISPGLCLFSMNIYFKGPLRITSTILCKLTLLFILTLPKVLGSLVTLTLLFEIVWMKCKSMRVKSSRIKSKTYTNENYANEKYVNEEYKNEKYTNGK